MHAKNTKGMLTYTEENYLKTIYHLSDAGQIPVSTNEIASSVNTKAATVTDMVKKLSAKDLVEYEKYYGVNVTRKGKALALEVVRKHRLWETFLVQKLGFEWDQIHDVAEQLEHIQSPLLIEKLDAFLGFPHSDPHGHPIPDKNGKIKIEKQSLLSTVTAGKEYVVCAVKDGTSNFLQYLSKIGVRIGAIIQVLERVEFDSSMEIIIDNEKRLIISREASENILVKE